MFGFSAWVIFPLLLGQMLVGVNFISSVPTAWILANIVFALAMIPIILWIVRRSRFAGSLQDAIVGKHILEAENFLQDIQSFKTP